MTERPIIQPTYSLSFWDFEIPSETYIKVYRPGDRINRESFVPFIVWSFAISRGTPQGQASAMEWVSQHNGFDFRETIKNFNLAGGISCLSENEQQILLQAVKGVNKHTEREILNCTDAELLEKIENEFLHSVDYSDASMFARSAEMKDMDWDSFIVLLNQRIDKKLEYDRTHRYGWF